VADLIPPPMHPAYTLTEMSRLTSMSPRRVRRMLDHAGIKYRRSGGQYLVFVSQIQARLPDLWDSVVTCEQMRAIARALEEPREPRH
jgi:hypothetical protein